MRQRNKKKDVWHGTFLGAVSWGVASFFLTWDGTKTNMKALVYRKYDFSSPANTFYMICVQRLNTETFLWSAGVLAHMKMPSDHDRTNNWQLNPLPQAKRQLNDFSSFLIHGEIYAMSKNAKLDSEKWKVNTPQRYSSSFIRRKHLRVKASWKMREHWLTVPSWSWHCPWGPMWWGCCRWPTGPARSPGCLCPPPSPCFAQPLKKRGSFCLIHSECSWLDSQLINLFMPHYSWADRLAIKSYIMFWPRSLVIPWYHHW